MYVVTEGVFVLCLRMLKTTRRLWTRQSWEVLHDLDNIANAVAILFGLMYSLDLSYPTNLKYTFEVLQKLVMELDGNKLSTKAQGFGTVC